MTSEGLRTKPLGTSALYEYARVYATRRIREGTLPRTAAEDAAATYDLEPWEAADLADELEAEPSAGHPVDMVFVEGGELEVWST